MRLIKTITPKEWYEYIRSRSPAPTDDKSIFIYDLKMLESGAVIEMHKYEELMLLASKNGDVLAEEKFTKLFFLWKDTCEAVGELLNYEDEFDL